MKAGALAEGWLACLELNGRRGFSRPALFIFGEFLAFSMVFSPAGLV